MSVMSDALQMRAHEKHVDENCARSGITTKYMHVYCIVYTFVINGHSFWACITTIRTTLAPPPCLGPYKHLSYSLAGSLTLIGHNTTSIGSSIT